MHVAAGAGAGGAVAAGITILPKSDFLTYPESGFLFFCFSAAASAVLA